MERDMGFPKHFVIVDAVFSESLKGEKIVPFSRNGRNYLKVPILAFVKHGGVFKNMSE